VGWSQVEGLDPLSIPTLAWGNIAGSTQEYKSFHPPPSLKVSESWCLVNKMPTTSKEYHWLPQLVHICLLWGMWCSNFQLLHLLLARLPFMHGFQVSQIEITLGYPHSPTQMHIGCSVGPPVMDRWWGRFLWNF